MDLITSNTMKITDLALDGLLERQRAISANTANVMTPGYQRKEVSFESQLSEIIEKDDLKDYIKGQNSIKYNPTSLEEITGIAPERKSLTLQEARFLKSDIYQDFNPQIMDDVYTGGTLDGNNVELEKEMMDMSKTGMQYILLSNLQKQSFSGLSSIIKGE